MVRCLAFNPPGTSLHALDIARRRGQTLEGSRHVALGFLSVDLYKVSSSLNVNKWILMITFLHSRPNVIYGKIKVSTSQALPTAILLYCCSKLHTGYFPAFLYAASSVYVKFGGAQAACLIG